MLSLEETSPPAEPTRVKAFVRFFKNYMSLSSVITAALPIPVTVFGLIPTFRAQTKFLSTYTSLFCFLLLGFVFFSRHALARLFFPETLLSSVTHGSDGVTRTGGLGLARMYMAFLPLVLIIFSLMFVYLYHLYLNQAIYKLQTAAAVHTSSSPTQYQLLLENAESSRIEGASWLSLCYLCIFLTAEAAFILMAIKEYLQDLLGLSDIDLIRGHRVLPNPAPAPDC